VRLDRIEKVFKDGQTALGGVDLEAADGEMIVLVGPSGCGKSTLLRIVAGLETPTRGRVFIGDRDVTDLPPQERGVAMVFQNYALYPHMTVRENLAFGLRMRGADRRTLEERVKSVSLSLGIEDLLDRRPAQLSGGQRQRVALGRAMARQAGVFLLDEPLSNLDAALRLQARTELARLRRRIEATLIYVTHDQEEAMTLADRIVILRQGRVQQIGRPLQIYERPATAFVGGFVGSPSMNFVRGHLRAGGTRFESPGISLDLAGASLPTSSESEALLGIRPEDIALASPGPGAVTAKVDVIEPLGREVLLHAEVERPASISPDLPRARLVLLALPSSAPAHGATVGLRLRGDRVHLFDPSTGLRLN
jgi:multiple sugar transport system ATP-binding protein